jgi:hypothetical protein
MTDTERAEYNDVIRKLTMRLEEAVGEIDRLKNVVAKVTGTDDAHSTLRRLYLDEAQNPNTRVRAAQAALHVESAPLKPVAQIELKADDPDSNLPLAELVAKRRAYAHHLALTDPKYKNLPKTLYSSKGSEVFVYRTDDDGDGNGDSGDAS